MAINFDKLVLGPCSAAFGAPVTYYPLASRPGQPSHSVRGIFSAVHEMVEFRDSHGQELTPHSTQHPVLAVRLSDMPASPKAADEVLIQGTTYQVWDVQPDGEGKVDLILRVA